MASRTRKRPDWLTGGHGDEVTTRPVSGSRQPTDELGPAAGESAPATARERNGASASQGEGVPRVSLGGKGAARSAAARQVVEEAKGRPLLLIILATVLLAVLAIVYFFLISPRLGDGPAERTQATGPLARQGEGGAAPGPVEDTGVAFSALGENGGTATLEGEGSAEGLEWTGTVAKKKDGAGETVTLQGPTAAQIERGFELEDGAVETGVYAVAQEDGAVLHVVTHTYLPKGRGEEFTRGSIFGLENGRLAEHGTYTDRRAGGFEVVRTYTPEVGRPYRVSFDSPPAQSTVPFLVGYRTDPQTEKEGE